MKPDSIVAKLLGVKTTPAASAEIAALQAEFDAFKVSAEADKAELSTALTTAVETATALETERDALKAQLEALQAEKAEAAAKAEEAKLSARRARIEAAIGSERVEATMAVVANLTDENFETVMAAMAAGSDKEAQSPLFQEQGVEAKASAEVANGESKEMQLIKSKYPEKATA